MKLFEYAVKVFSDNFPATAWFERAVFCSWYCEHRDCKFCFMSTQPPRKAGVRSFSSLLTETLLCMHFGWRISFLAGGVNAYGASNLERLLKVMTKVYGERVWLNVGELDESTLKRFKPYIKGVIAAVETINPKLRKQLCPSKPTGERMLKIASKLHLKSGMGFIVGLGETQQDYALLKGFIEHNSISKISFYALNPQKGTSFEKSPGVEEQAWWIAKTRVDFPKMDIQAGIWHDKASRVAELLNAGANSITKFPVLKYFGSKQAKEIEGGVRAAGRSFLGTMTNPKPMDIKRLVEKVPVEYREKTEATLRDYMQKTLKMDQV